MAEEVKEEKNTAEDKNDNSWADMIEVKEDGKTAPSIAGSDAKILNQEEIDSLLGYDNSDTEGEYHSMKTGVRAILNSSMVSYERLPMLEIVFDRQIRLMATSLRLSLIHI